MALPELSRGVPTYQLYDVVRAASFPKPFPQAFPYDILSIIVSIAQTDKNTLLTLSCTSRDLCHLATSYLWSSFALASPTPDRMTARIEETLAHNPMRARCVQRLKVHIPEPPTVRLASKSRPVSARSPKGQETQRRVPEEDTEDEEQDDEKWSEWHVTRMLDALCAALDSVQNASTLIIESDGAFERLARRLSDWAAGDVVPSELVSNGDEAAPGSRYVDSTWLRRHCLPNLVNLETNLYAADGLTGFLAAHPKVESLKLHMRRDRWSEDPPSSPSPGTVTLPNLAHLSTMPLRMSLLTMRRPVRSIETTIRDAGHVQALIHAIGASGARVESLKVRVLSVDVLELLVRGLHDMSWGVPPDADPVDERLLAALSLSETTPGQPSPSSNASSEKPGVFRNQGCPLSSLHITLLELSPRYTHDPIAVSHVVNASNPLDRDTDHPSFLLLFRSASFASLRTLHWGGVLLPFVRMRDPGWYLGTGAGRASGVKEVILSNMTFRLTKWVWNWAEDAASEGGGGSWKKMDAPAPKADGSRRREVFARIMAPDPYARITSTA